MAVDLDQRASSCLAERPVEGCIDEFTDEFGRLGQCSACVTPGKSARRSFIAEGRHAGGFKTDHRCASADLQCESVENFAPALSRGQACPDRRAVGRSTEPDLE